MNNKEILKSFVGCTGELQLLSEAAEECRETKTPKFLLIKGDFGTGKTTLVEKFLSLSKNKSVLVGEAFCYIDKEGNGLFPFSQVLSSLLEEGVRRKVVFEGILEFVKEVAPAWLDILTLGAASATVKAATLTIEETGKLLGKRSFSQDNVFTQFTNAIKRLAEKHPVIIFLDDIHWADASSLGLLFHLIRCLGEKPVLVICTYRPVEAGTGPNADLFSEIRANFIRYGAKEIELTPNLNVAEYIAKRFPNNNFPLDLTDLVQKKTEGHPLYVSQLLSLWQDKKIILSEGSQKEKVSWIIDKQAFAAAQNSPIPELNEVLQDRIQRLESNLREALNIASVQGMDFTAQLVSRIKKIPEYEIYDALGLLEHQYYLIQQEGVKEVSLILLDFYHFAHRFIHEHIYQQLKLNHGKYRLLHKMVGECLEELFTTRDAVAGQLAQHFCEAYEFKKAIHYSLLASRFEAAHYAWVEAERWREFGTNLLGEIKDSKEHDLLEIELLEQSGSNQYAFGNWDATQAKYKSALELASRVGLADNRKINLYLILADICDNKNELKLGADYLKQAMDILSTQTEPDPRLQMTAYVSKGLLQIRNGDNQSAIGTFRDALGFVESKNEDIQPVSAVSKCYNCLAIAYSNLNQYEAMIAAFRKSIDLSEKIGDKKSQAISLLNLTDDLLFLERYQEAENVNSQALALSRQIGDLDSEAYALENGGRIFLANKQPQEAISSLNQSLAIAQDIHANWILPSVYADLALSYLSTNNLEKADEAARKAKENAISNGYPFFLGYAFDTAGRVETAKGNWAQSNQDFEKAVEYYDSEGDKHLSAIATFHHAESLVIQKKFPEASAALRKAMGIFKDIELTGISECEIAEQMLAKISSKEQV